MLGVDAQVWRESAQLLTHHNHLLATDYWADMWSWRQVRPDETAWREVGLAHYWPDANEERQDVRMGQDIPDCFGEMKDMTQMGTPPPHIRYQEVELLPMSRNSARW